MKSADTISEINLIEAGDVAEAIKYHREIARRLTFEKASSSSRSEERYASA